MLRCRRLPWLGRALVGACFVLAAIGKLADFDDFLVKAAYYRAVPYVWVAPSAWATVAAEFAVGAALLAGWPRRWPRRAAIALLAAFSALVAHAWHAYGITDCACLGAIAETPPWLGIAKNCGMLVLLWWCRELPDHGAAASGPGLPRTV
ncbi:MAG: DoxX family membrane protein [Planctomycetes bacterium]|nr:DoxX family membrane protein [Planctomycetota bacterium]